MSSLVQKQLRPFHDILVYSEYTQDMYSTMLIMFQQEIHLNTPWKLLSKKYHLYLNIH